MALRMMSPIPARVVQVLKDYLLAETALIDAEENDGVTTPTIPAANFYDYDLRKIDQFPACTIRSVSSTPVDIKPDAFGQRIDARHRIEIMFHASIANAQDSRTLEKIMHRWANAAIRLMALVKWGLQTVADPVEWGTPTVRTVAEWNDAATYGPEADQGDGAVVRTTTVPIEVRRIEARI